jgi:hypothetical protein
MRSFVLVILGAAAVVALDPAVALAAEPPASSPAQAAISETPPAQPASDPVASSPPQAPGETTTMKEKSEKDEKVEKDEGHTAYVSFSPIHLLLPLVELMGELRLHRHVGVAVIAGYGSVKPEGSTTRFSVLEVGGQLVGYPVGHFDHGMQLGVEVLYVGVSGSDRSGGERISGAAQGLAMGPLVGYKFASKVGFSLNVQGGVQYVALRANASSTSGATASAEDSSVIPLLNFNLGWSF